MFGLRCVFLAWLFAGLVGLSGGAAERSVRMSEGGNHRLY